MIAQHLRHPLEGFDFRPGFWGLEWSCPSPWQVPEGIKIPDVRTLKDDEVKKEELRDINFLTLFFGCAVMFEQGER